MKIETTVNDDFRSNNFLVFDHPGGHGVLIDSGGPTGRFLESIERNRLTVEHLLVTHHHWDHVAGNAELKEKLGVTILAHPFEAQELSKYPELANADNEINDGAILRVGDLNIEALHTPGHTAGMLAFAVNNEVVFSGDTLFKGSVGGNKVLGSTTFEDLRSSIMDVLMKLPPETVVHSGHESPTTIGAEWQDNPFVRVWRGLDPESTEKCMVRDDPATLVLWAPDYDGGFKAWVRWDDTGKDDIIPGSMVTRS